MKWTNDNIQVIDRASSNFKLRMKEQPELNKQLNSQSDYEIKTLIIQAYVSFIYIYAY